MSGISSAIARLDAAAKAAACTPGVAEGIFTAAIGPIVAGFCAEAPELCPAAVELGNTLIEGAAADFRSRECK